MEGQEERKSIKSILKQPLLAEYDDQENQNFEQQADVPYPDLNNLFQENHNSDENENQEIDLIQLDNELSKIKRHLKLMQNQGEDTSRKTIFIRDSLDLYYGEQNNLKVDDQELQEKRLEIFDNQMEAIFNLIEFGYSLEYAVIVIDKSKSTELQQIYEFLDQNPDVEFHGFQPKQNCDAFQSFGVSQNVELCKICNQILGNHDYIITSKQDDEESQKNYFSRFSNQNDVLRSLNNIQLIRENNNGQIQIVNVDENDLSNANKLRKLQPKTNRECQICYEEMELKHIVNFEGQYHDICLSCFQTFLNESIKEGKVLNLSCPHCDKKLTYKFIQKILDRSTFTKYRQFLLDQLVSIDPFMRWCPNPKCGQSIKLNKGFKRKEQCTQCKTFVCTECNREYHKGSCNSVFKKEIKKWEDNSDIQRCQICKTVVAKVSGCNHMTCKVCGYEWCWLCGSRYDKIHFFSLNPFGCASLQFNSIVGWRLVLYKLMIFLLCILIFPFLLVFSVPVYFISLSRNFMYYQKKFVQVLLYPLIFIVGLIVQPLADALFFICLIPGLVVIFYYRRKEKKQQIEISKQKLLKNQIVSNLGIQIEDLR